jgi:hypothetical protein
MTKSHERRLSGQVRRWLEKADDTDKSRPLPERTEQADELARRLGLPVARADKAGNRHKKGN